MSTGHGHSSHGGHGHGGYGHGRYGDGGYGHGGHHFCLKSSQKGSTGLDWSEKLG